jgi:hypothetical protein
MPTVTTSNLPVAPARWPSRIPAQKLDPRSRARRILDAVMAVTAPQRALKGLAAADSDVNTQRIPEIGALEPAIIERKGLRANRSRDRVSNRCDSFTLFQQPLCFPQSAWGLLSDGFSDHSVPPRNPSAHSVQYACSRGLRLRASAGRSSRSKAIRVWSE